MEIDGRGSALLCVLIVEVDEGSVFNEAFGIETGGFLLGAFDIQSPPRGSFFRTEFRLAGLLIVVFFWGHSKFIMSEERIWSEGTCNTPIFIAEIGSRVHLTSLMRGTHLGFPIVD